MHLPRVRTIAFSAALGWALLAAGPELAGAGTVGEPEETRFSWHPSVEFDAFADDNVYLTEDDTLGDVGVRLFPRVELGLHSRNLHAGADLALDVRGYRKDESPDDVFVRFGFFAELGLLPGLTARVSDAYAPTPVDIGAPPDHTSNLIQTNRAAISLRHWSEIPNDREMTLSLTMARHTSQGFDARPDDGEVIASFHANFWEWSAMGEFHSPVTENISGFVRAHTRWRSFDESEESDFADLSLLLGISTQWWESVDFDFALGIGRLAFEDQGQTRFIGDANVRYRVADGTTLRLQLYQRNTADIVGNSFAESTGRFDVERRFGERMAASLGMFITRANGEVYDDDANFFGGIEASGRYQLTRRSQLELIYRHWENAGGYSSDDFRQNQISLGFTYRH